MSIIGTKLYHAKITQGDTDYQLEYEIFHEQRCIEDADITVYGIIVRKLGNAQTESVTVPDISSEPEGVAWMAGTLARNSVTPCTAKDVIIDLLSET